MARIVLLDAGPLGLACSRRGLAEVERCRLWLIGLEHGGARLLIPTIADYEVRRELLRLNADRQLRELDLLRDRFRIAEVTAAALDRAAEFWSGLRAGGIPTASPESLDADAILAGVAATLPGQRDTLTVATTNVRHLARFPGIDARYWHAID